MQQVEGGNLVQIVWGLKSPNQDTSRLVLWASSMSIGEKTRMTTKRATLQLPVLAALLVVAMMATCAFAAPTMAATNAAMANNSATLTLTNPATGTVATNQVVFKEAKAGYTADIVANTNTTAAKSSVKPGTSTAMTGTSPEIVGQNGAQLKTPIVGAASTNGASITMVSTIAANLTVRTQPMDYGAARTNLNVC